MAEALSGSSSDSTLKLTHDTIGKISTSAPFVVFSVTKLRLLFRSNLDHLGQTLAPDNLHIGTLMRLGIIKTSSNVG